jgi:hypothetical protein
VGRDFGDAHPFSLINCWERTSVSGARSVCPCRYEAAIEASAALKNPQPLAMIDTRSKYAKPSVVALTGNT